MPSLRLGLQVNLPLSAVYLLPRAFLAIWTAVLHESRNVLMKRACPPLDVEKVPHGIACRAMGACPVARAGT